MSFRIPRQDTELRFVTKFGGNQPLRSFRKFVWFTTSHKNSAGLVSAPFCPKWADRAQTFLNTVTLDMSTYTEFGPDRLRFAGLILERLIFRPKKSYGCSLQLHSTLYKVFIIAY